MWNTGPKPLRLLHWGTSYSFPECTASLAAEGSCQILTQVSLSLVLHASDSEWSPLLLMDWTEHAGCKSYTTCDPDEVISRGEIRMPGHVLDRKCLLPIPHFFERGVYYFPIQCFPHSTLCVYVCVCVYACGTGVWTQYLMLARQVLYHLNHSPSLFGINYFLDRVSSFSQGLDSDHNSIYASHVAGITGVCHHPSWFDEMELC
jgi:hypothetical protein